MKTFKQFIAPIATWAKTNLPEILISLGIASYASATIFAVTGTVKAVKTVEELIDEKGEVPTKVEILKATWKHYIPVVLTFTAGTVCVIVSNRESAKRIAALVTAYSMSEKKVEGYSKKIEELLGKEKASEIESAVEQEEAKRNEDKYRTIIENIPDEYIPLWYDAFTGRFFRAKKDWIDRASDTINRNIDNGDTMTLNDLFYEIAAEAKRCRGKDQPYIDLGIDQCDAGDANGWDAMTTGSLRIDVKDYFTTYASGHEEHAGILRYNIANLYSKLN